MFVRSFLSIQQNEDVYVFTLISHYHSWLWTVSVRNVKGLFPVGEWNVQSLPLVTSALGNGVPMDFLIVPRYWFLITITTSLFNVFINTIEIMKYL